MNISATCSGWERKFCSLRARYTVSLSAALVVLNVLSMIMFIWLFGPSSSVWNADFMTQIGTEWSLSADAALLWSIVPKILVGLCIFGNVVDSIRSGTASRLPHNPQKPSSGPEGKAASGPDILYRNTGESAYNSVANRITSPSKNSSTTVTGNIFILRPAYISFKKING